MSDHVVDISQTIIAKSDQLNSDDLIAGPLTIKITDVAVRQGEQPVVINYVGDKGKPWLPCKSMRRVLAQLWGTDGKKYLGRRVTLYRDPSVRFGGQDVGGIRISHMSDIDGEKVMSLTTTRATKKPFRVLPLSADEVAMLKEESTRLYEALGVPEADRKAYSKRIIGDRKLSALEAARAIVVSLRETVEANAIADKAQEGGEQ